MDHLQKAAEVLGMPAGDLLGTDAKVGITVTDPNTIALVRLFGLMKPRQRDLHLQLFYAAVGASEPGKAKSDPSDGLGTVAAGSAE